ncbi:VENN motif pre-toxin domain-containing protein, partial [Neisseriaceae bacterium ESL0693]|nr:VENN motif pre-toxin domain-containing protein [Neisseriaceae bacterium ESL0693]
LTEEEYNNQVGDLDKVNVLIGMIAGGLGAPTSNAAGIIAATASPAVAYEIGQYFKEQAYLNQLNGQGDQLTTAQEAAHLLAHAALGAAVAATGGNNALVGAASAAGAEAAAPALAHWLYDKDPSDLTSDEKQTISSIVGLAGAAVGATTGNSADIVSGAQAGQNAVDNNLLINLNGTNKLNAQEKAIINKLKQAGVQSTDDYQKRYDQCQTSACRQEVIKEFQQASDQTGKIIADLYHQGILSQDEYLTLVTNIAGKMKDADRDSALATSGHGDIFDMDGQNWTSGAIAGNPFFDAVRTEILLQRLKESGASDEQIAQKIEQNQVASSLLSSLPLDQQAAYFSMAGIGADALIGLVTRGKGRQSLSPAQLAEIEKGVEKGKANASYKPNQGAIANMGDYFKQPGVGSELGKNSQKSSKIYQGQTVYVATDKMKDYGIKKGDQFYLDGEHKNHIEVFDKNGDFKHVLNLDGTVNPAKTEAGKGRKLPK